MREGKYYIDFFNKEKTEGSLSLEESKYYELLAVQISDLFQLYHEQDYEKLQICLNEQRKLRKMWTKVLNDYSNQTILMITRFVQNFNIFNKLLQEKNKRISFSDEMQIVLSTYGHAEKVLIYLYKHPRVRHNEIMKENNIAKSSLTDLLQVLVLVQCVEKIRYKKTALYDLTKEGRNYVKENNIDIDEEDDIDFIDVYCEEFITIKAKNNLFETSLYLNKGKNANTEKIKIYNMFEKNKCFGDKRQDIKWEMNKWTDNGKNYIEEGV